MTKSRDITFDIMKGIGILLVITAHFFGWNHPVLDQGINSFHMPMFFCVAGYFSKAFTSWSDVRVQVAKFARRLLPAFVFTQTCIILWTVLMALTRGDSWGQVALQTLSLFWADPHGPHTPWGQLYVGIIWFLLALFVAKCLLLLLSRQKGWAIPISIALAVGALLLYKVLPYSIWCISLGLMGLPFLTIGWWARTHKIPVWFILVCIVCWVVAVLYSHLGMYDMEWDCYPLNFLGALGGTFCLYFVSKFLGRYFRVLPRVLAILGIWSLAIMCFHNLELDCHLGNHAMSVIPFAIPVWGKYVFRYLLTVGLAALAVHTPGLKRLFV